MDYNIYLMGVYGARGSNGHMLGYHTIAKEMQILQNMHTEGYKCPSIKEVTVCGEFVGKALLNGEDVRQLALKHLEEIWPTYFNSGKHPLPKSTWNNQRKG